MHRPTGDEVSGAGTNRPLSTALRNPLPKRTIHTANQQTEEKPIADFRDRAQMAGATVFPMIPAPSFHRKQGAEKMASAVFVADGAPNAPQMRKTSEDGGKSLRCAEFPPSTGIHYLHFLTDS